MSSLAPDNSKRRDVRRKRKSEPVVSDVESDGDDIEDHQYSQPRASPHSKKAPKAQKGTGPIYFEINGDFSFKGNLKLGPERRDSRRRATVPPSSRGPNSAAQPTRPRRFTTQCDTPTDPQTESEEESSSYSDENPPQIAPKRRSTKPMLQPREPRKISDLRTKRYLPDEGYHTGRSASYTAEVNKQYGKGKGKLIASGGNSSRHARLSSSVKARKSRTVEPEASATNSEADQVESSESSADDEPEKNGEEEDNEDEEQDEEDDATDDDFGKLLIQISGTDPQYTTGQAIDEKAILDTGTKPDWISQTFYDKLRKIGIKAVKLSPEEQKRKYSDFNGKKFSPESKVNLMIQSDEFQGKVKCRILSFFIARNATFSILIGRDTIRNHELMTRGKRDTEGEGVLVGQHGEISEAEKAEMKRRKEEKNRIAQERKRQREEKREEKSKEKNNDRTTSNKDAAHLATLVSRGGRPRSPPKGTSEVAKLSKKPSESSLDGTW